MLIYMQFEADRIDRNLPYNYLIKEKLSLLTRCILTGCLLRNALKMNYISLLNNAMIENNVHCIKLITLKRVMDNVLYAFQHS